MRPPEAIPAHTATNSIVLSSRHIDHPDAHTEVVTEHQQLADGRHVRTQTVQSHRDDGRSTVDYSSAQQSSIQEHIEPRSSDTNDTNNTTTTKYRQSQQQQFIDTERLAADGDGPHRRSTVTRTSQQHDYFVRTLRSASPPPTPPLQSGSRPASQSSSPARPSVGGLSSSRGSSSTRTGGRADSPCSGSSSRSPSRQPFYLSDDQPEKLQQQRQQSPRPPLVRSETYEERCRQILGMSQTGSRRSSAEEIASQTAAKSSTKTTTSTTTSVTTSAVKRSASPKRTSSRPSSPAKQQQQPQSTPVQRTSSPKRPASRSASPTKPTASVTVTLTTTAKAVRNTSPKRTPSRSGSPSKQQPAKVAADQTTSIATKREPSPAKPIVTSHVSSATIVLSPPAKRRSQKPVATVDRPTTATTKSTTTSATARRHAHQLVTERKESAPVYGISTKPSAGSVPAEADHSPAKIVRSSTSDGVIRPLGTAATVTAPKTTSPKTAGQRPVKCLATKTLTVKSTAHLLRSEDFENVQIDIQLAKSSREPSPDRIVPTPVSPDEDTDGGPPRFPDTVVEPDDGRQSPRRGGNAQRRRQTVDDGRCRITEVEIEEACLVESSADETEEEEEATDVNAAVDDDDPSLLSVQDKVLKVLHTVEEAAHTKSSVAFDTKHTERLASNVSGKITQFITIAENLSKQTVPKPFRAAVPNRAAATTPATAARRSSSVDECDGNEREARDDIVADGDECLLSVSDKISRFMAAATVADPIAVPVPQKSPKLVATIERRLSRQQSHDQRPEAQGSVEAGADTMTVDVDVRPPAQARRSSAELQRVRSIFERKSSAEEERSGGVTRVDRNAAARDLKLTGKSFFVL